LPNYFRWRSIRQIRDNFAADELAGALVGNLDQQQVILAVPDPNGIGAGRMNKPVGSAINARLRRPGHTLGMVLDLSAQPL